MRRIDQQTIERLQWQAAGAPRRRCNLNLHSTLEDPVQRLYNAIEPGSYVRPHRHPGAGRWELFMALHGAAVILIFNAEGVVLQRLEICAGGPVFGAEIPPGDWHTVAALESGTVLFEFKPGPYEPVSDKDFATWAPTEVEASCRKWAEWFQNAKQGEQPPFASDDC